MYIESVPNRQSKPAILLRESYRESGKVKKRTLANLTNWPASIVSEFKKVLHGGKVIDNLQDSFQIVKSLPHGHVAAVLGTIKKLGIPRLLSRHDNRFRKIIVAMIACRILEPASKLATARELSEETLSSTLAEECGLENIDENDLYEAMDWLLLEQPRIEKGLATRHLKNGTLVLYDLSASYVEGKCCPLAKLGKPRDGKHGKSQIEYGLLCDSAGRPVAIEVFPGNTGDPTTLAIQISKLRERFGLERVVLVGDRGMITEARIREELRPVEGLDWISALRSGTISKLVTNKIIQPSLFDEKDMAEVKSPDFPDERLVACRNPFLRDERRRKREELLKATEKKLQKITDAVNRKKRPLRGKAEIGLRVGKVLNHFKVGKHFSIEMTDVSFVFSRKIEKIRKEEALDGIYVIRTSVCRKDLNSDEVVDSYKRLSVVERAFRCLKTVDLKIRPIYHYTADRVRSHIFLCMLAYYVEWHMREKLAPILFQDEEKESARKDRKSVVAPAITSKKAQAKARTKRTDDGMRVHSFRSLIKHLSALVRDTVKPEITGEHIFTKTTQPTPTQQRAFQLLGLK